ncbi:MAG: ABC transporter permease [Armatimonadetes bacterium]|nr:ABC transporter permease [Armatimonadota bacterium]NOG93565.1 ABC transporter permease [Armatimonadota bacterium]
MSGVVSAADGAIVSRRSGPGVGRLVLARVLWAIPTLIFITFLTFVIGELAPGDAATALAGEKGSSSPEVIERLREDLGLNDPLLTRYGRFVADALRLDFGKSWYPPFSEVRSILGQGFALTGLLALCAIAVASIVGVLLGAIAGIWHGRWPDKVATTFSTFGICIPTFVLAPVFVFIFAIRMKALPDTWVDNPPEGIFWYLVLPVSILAMRPAAVITRLTRASMVDTLGQDFIRTAYAKGVPFWRTMTVHAFRNSLVPVTTAIGTSFGYLLTGSFILETYFRIPGLGLRSIDAIYQGDFPVVQATVLLFAVLFILVNLVVDLLLPQLDPRIRTGGA